MRAVLTSPPPQVGGETRVLASSGERPFASHADARWLKTLRLGVDKALCCLSRYSNGGVHRKIERSVIATKYVVSATKLVVCATKYVASATHYDP